MTLYDVHRIFNWWKRFPPLSVLVAAFAKSFGVNLIDGQNSPDKPKPMTREEFEMMFRQTGGRINGVGSM